MMDNDEIDTWWKAVMAVCPSANQKMIEKRPLTEQESFFWEWSLDLTKNFTVDAAAADAAPTPVPADACGSVDASGESWGC